MSLEDAISSLESALSDVEYECRRLRREESALSDVEYECRRLRRELKSELVMQAMGLEKDTLKAVLKLCDLVGAEPGPEGSVHALAWQISNAVKDATRGRV